MDYLSIKMENVERGPVENVLCKAMRSKYSNREFYDMVGGNHNIYIYHDVVLKAYDANGVEMKVTPNEWCAEQSTPGAYLWESGFEQK